jgi:2-methylisocitrate lyase-like PEP mutase family enzyme
MSTTFAERRAGLKARLDAGRFVTAPGVFDLISAKIADSLGFDALYMTGFGVVASALGLPDAGLATYSEMVERAGLIAQSIAAPLIADADTGYGGLLNVRRTVRGYEAAGVAAIQLEDQVFPKKCGHVLGREVIPLEEMVQKIRVAADSRSSADFLIIARTDARTSLGLDEALRRAAAYRDAGADILFVESPESTDELRRIGATLDGKLLVNNVEGGRTPILPPAELQAMGFAAAIYPASGFLAAAAALTAVYGDLHARGTTLGSTAPRHDFAALCGLMGLGEVREFDARWK